MGGGKKNVCYTLRLVKLPLGSGAVFLLFPFHWSKPVRWSHLTSTWWGSLMLLLGEELGIGEEWSMLQQTLKGGHFLKLSPVPCQRIRVQGASQQLQSAFFLGDQWRRLYMYSPQLLTFGFQLDLCWLPWSLWRTDSSGDYIQICPVFHLITNHNNVNSKHLLRAMLFSKCFV